MKNSRVNRTLIDTSNARKTMPHFLRRRINYPCQGSGDWIEQMGNALVEHWISKKDRTKRGKTLDRYEQMRFLAK